MWRTEAVPDTSAQPHDARQPEIGLGEKAHQLPDHGRDPLPPMPGAPAGVDQEYNRCGTVNFGVTCEPL